MDPERTQNEAVQEQKAPETSKNARRRQLEIGVKPSQAPIS